MADVDDKYNPAKNPGEWDQSTGRRMADAEKSAASEDSTSRSNQDVEKNNDDNLSLARKSESSGNKNNASSKMQDIKPMSKASFGDRIKAKFKPSNLRKKGPIAFVISLIISAGTIFTVINSPGLLIVQIKEALFDDLMDSVASMDLRSRNIIKARISDNTVGKGCAKMSLARCKYKGMSEKQLDKLKKAGLEVKTSGKTITGKYKVESIRMAGGTPPHEEIKPKNFKKAFSSNPDFRARMMKAYSPRWMSVRDDVFKKISKKYKISLKRAIGGKSKEEMKRKLDADIKNGTTDEGKRGGRLQTDENGKTNLVDPVSNTAVTNVDGGEVDGRALTNTSEQMSRAADTNMGFSMKEGPIKALGALNSFTGKQAALCTMLKTLRTAGVVSRNLKYVQLLRYAVPFLNTADSIKNGTATPEAVSMVGDTLTKEDRKKKITDEESTAISESDSLFDVAKKANNSEPKLIDNPDKGKSATDSAGIRTAAYGETLDVSAREGKFSHNGAAGSKLSGLGNKIKGLPGFNSNKCSFYGDPAVQIGGALLSLGVIGVACAPILPTAGGTCGTAIRGIGKGIAQSVGFMILQMAVTSYLMNMVANITKGTLVSSDLTGVDAGNALFSGAAALGGTTASARGMQPLSTHDEVKNYQVTAMRNKAENYETDQVLARDTPFDIYNRASFLGSMVWSVSPQVRSSSRTLAGIISLPFTLLGSMPNWLLPASHAATLSDISRYERNDEDEIYKGMGEGGLQGSDVMGNIRYGMTDEQLNADPTKIVEWMVDARQVDANTGEVLKTRDALNAAACIPPNRPEEIAYMGFDDEITLAQKQTTATYANYEMPFPVGGREDAPGDCSENAGPEARMSRYAKDDPEKDVRTYAHFLRYCRMGDENGRTVAFGDQDGGKDEDGFVANILNGIGSSDWQSDGRECLRSNACKANQDPNAGTHPGDNQWEYFCRPSYYDIYAVYTMDNGGDGKSGIGDSMDKDEDEAQEDDKADQGNVGDAKEMAKKVLAEKNIILTPQTKAALQKFADTGEAINACDEKFVINPLLSWVLLENAKKYKITVNNFGFKTDRNIRECIATSGYQHPRGNAVDLNGVERTDSSGGGNQQWGSINFSGGQTQLITDFTADWMNNLATKEPTRGRVGQINCGGFNMLHHKDRSKWKGPDGNLHFSDSCDHLHIEVTDREDIKKDDPK